METERPHPPLARARALIVGVGGLGSPAATALAVAGIGGLGLADPDVVELSNLPRQPLYATTDVGRPKVAVAAERLRALVPGLPIEAWRKRVTSGDVSFARAFDVILDGTDTIAAKFAVNDLAVTAGVPLVHAGVLGFRAQLLTVLPHASACYRCLFEEAPPPGDVPSCEEAGVLGPVAALAGALQAAEAVRIVCGADAAFAGRLLAIDLRAGSFRSVPVPPNPRCAACHLPQVPASGRSDAA
jgi:molybdopterin/thiamine biosynthesis adenylyltransferase